MAVRRVELPAEDVDMASLVLRANGGQDPSVRPLSVALGAAIGLMVAGLAALVAVRASRRKT